MKGRERGSEVLKEDGRGVVGERKEKGEKNGGERGKMKIFKMERAANRSLRLFVRELEVIS